MPHGHTLNSRVRVLIAKTFKAERLFSSIVNVPGAPIAGAALVSDLANDIRSKEWQKSHAHLRTCLNNLIESSPPAKLGSELALLHKQFADRAAEGALVCERGTASLIDAGKKHEFAHVMKISFELMRAKAKAQANSVIADELSALLSASGRAGELAKAELTAGLSKVSDAQAYTSLESSGQQDAASETNALELAAPATSNVISFEQRRANAGKFYRR